MKTFDPTKDTIDLYTIRLGKQVAALKALGEEIPQTTIDQLIEIAKYRIKLWAECKRPEESVRYLKKEFYFEVNEDSDSLKLKALELLLKELGQDPAQIKQQVNDGKRLTPSPPARTAEFAQRDGAESVRSQDVTDLETKLKQVEIELVQMKLLKEEQKGNIADNKELINALREGFAENATMMRDAIGDSKEAQKRPMSTIKVEPKFRWPSLGDENTGGKDVEIFYERFEEIMNLSNNGKGMAWPEMMMTLKSCLWGSRRQIYDNITTIKRKEGGGKILDHKGAYQEIKDRLFRFTETAMERQLRVATEWENFYKTPRMNAMQFEAKWENLHANLQDAGLGKTTLELYLAYLQKVGTEAAKEIRKDRRPRPDESGGTTT